MTRDGSNCPLTSIVSATSGASRSAEEEDAPVLDPEYGDLLDTQWLERGTDALDPEDDLVDIGLTIELDDGDNSDELAQMTELDVGALLTSLPEDDDALNLSLDLTEQAERAPREVSVGLGVLQDLLLPEERSERRREDDEAVGNDESFPVFDGVSAPPAFDDDADGPTEES